MTKPVGVECQEILPFTELTSDLLAKDVMVCGVTSIDPKQHIAKAVSLMLEKKITGLPVVHQESLVGILSDKDLLRNFYEIAYLPGTAEDYMVKKVITFDIEDRFEDICQCFISNSFRRVPIICQEKLAGMITRSDVIKTFLKSSRIQNPVSQGHKLTAEKAMKYGLKTLRPEASLIEAMEIIVNHRITGIPIVSSTLELLGIITEKDLLQAMGSPEVMSATVEQYMTRKVICFSRTSELSSICKCLLKHSFHQVPIVDNNTLVGIISRSDIIKIRTQNFKF
jgi:CBS domain-containing protein